MENMHLIKKLLPLMEKPSDTFPKLVTKILQDHYSLLAVCFYRYDHHSSDNLLLLGQSGFPLSAFESLQLSTHNSLAGRALKEKDILSISNVCEKECVQNHLDYTKLFEQPTTLIALPLTSEGVETSLSVGNNPFYAVIYLYTKATNNNIESLLNSLKLIAEFISEIYLRAIVHDQILLRQEIIDKAFLAKDLNSFSHGVLGILRENWGIEAASVYMLDERIDALRLCATTGLADKKRSKETVLISVNKKKKKVKNHVYDCFESKKILRTNMMSGEREAYSMPLASIILIPIFQIARGANQLKGRRVIGVLKCVNRIIYQDYRLKEATSFNFSDENRLVLSADFIGAIAKLFWRVTHIHEDFERTVHGVLNNVITIRASLSTLDRHGNLDSYLKAKMHYIIPDSIGHLDALKWQIEKFSNRDRKTEINRKKVFIHGDVLAKAIQIARPLALYFNVKLELKNGIDSNSLYEIPPIDTDPDLLVTVFRNLIENSIKYAKRDTLCEIHIWWEEFDGAVRIFMQDNGIGIDREDQEMIFAEGFRSEEAIRRVTSGASAGLGLFQCRAIMQELDGKIELENNRNQTIFLITIPKWRIS